MFEKEQELISKSTKVSKKEGIELMLKNPELLAPLVYLLFAVRSGLSELLPHDKYCSLMKRKAIQTNNKKLLKMVEEAEGRI